MHRHLFDRFAPAQVELTNPRVRRSLSRLALLTTLVISLLPAPVFAQAGRSWKGPQENQDPTASAPVRGQPLSLSEAIALGVQNNLGVVVNRYSPYVAEMERDAAWGIYDPTLTSNISFSESKIPRSNVFSQTFFDDTQNLDGGMGVSALVPYLGATIGAQFSGASADTNTAFPLFNPELRSTLTFSADVPLMQGLIWNEAWTSVKTTALASDAARSNFETSVMDTVQQIITDYWNLVATKEQWRVAIKSLETTTALLDQTRTQYEVGVVSKVEVVQSEAGVASSEFNLIVARNAYQNAQDQLMATVLGTQFTAATSLTFDPTDNPQYEAVKYVDVNAAVATAFEKRPEIQSAQDTIDQSKISRRFARNQRLPQLNFNAAYTTLGISGDARPARPADPLPPPPDGNFADTFDQYYRDNKDWTVGATFTIPIPNTTARKNFHKAEFQLRQAESSRTQLKQNIIVTIRSSARGLIASAQGVEAAERRRIAAAEQLRAERIRLEHGESTPFDVLQREKDLVDAESQKITALQSFRNSQTALDRAEGTILEKQNVQIDQVRQLR